MIAKTNNRWAGVFIDSGIKDFHGENGLYKKNLVGQVEYLLSIQCLLKELI